MKKFFMLLLAAAGCMAAAEPTEPSTKRARLEAGGDSARTKPLSSVPRR